MSECKINPFICGRSRISIPTHIECQRSHFEGIDDVVINQGVGIDLSSGVSAYDEDGDSIPFTYEPASIDKCDVGVHNVQYTAYDCDGDVIYGERTVTIEQADPPTFTGVNNVLIETNEAFDPTENVVATDDNGNNLSYTYYGKMNDEAKGAIASFVTDLDDPALSCIVNINPVQDGTPWQSTTEEQEPYFFRAIPNVGHSVNSEYDTLVGGSVAWNQLVENGNFVDGSHWGNGGSGSTSMSVANNVMTFTANATGGGIYHTNPTRLFPNSATQHKYYACANIKLTTATTKVKLRLNGGYKQIYTIGTTDWQTVECLYSLNNADNGYIQILDDRTSGWDSVQIKNVMLVDLTQMFGSTIADYIYTLEQNNSGDGVAWFRKYFSNTYYDYNAGEIKSVEATAHVTRGFNQWDEEWEVGAYSSSDGTKVNASNRIRCKNFIPVVPSTSYYIKSSSSISVYGYDYNGEFVRQLTTVQNMSQTIPKDVYYITFNTGVNSGSTYNNNICINISNANLNGTYEPYTSHTYPLGNVTLRGIPKLDANNKLYYDGDIYESDGTVTRKYGIVDLSTWDWNYSSAYSTEGLAVWHYTPSDAKGVNTSTKANAICEKYEVTSTNNVITTPNCIGVTNNVTPNRVWCSTTSQSITPSGSFLYELATSTTESADPFTSPQEVDTNGSEEYVTTSLIPIGHKSRLADIYPISGWASVDAFLRGKNLFGGSDGNYTIGSTRHIVVGNGITSYVVDTSASSAVFLPEATLSSYLGNKTLPIGTYTFSVDTNALSTAKVQTLTLNLSDGTTATNGSTFTISSNADIVSITTPVAESYSVGTYTCQVQIEVGSIETTYEAYNGTTYTVSWQDEAGTVYFGYIDIVSGLLVVTYYEFILDGTETIGTSVSSQGKRYFTYSLPYESVNTSAAIPLYSNMFKSESSVNVGNAYITGYGLIIVFVLPQDITTTQEAKSLLAQQNAHFIVPLATPQEYYLTPQEVQTLIGQNNIWADSNIGDVDVIYKKSIPQGQDVEYPLDGKYIITYTAEDECGNSATVDREITVYDAS